MTGLPRGGKSGRGEEGKARQRLEGCAPARGAPGTPRSWKRREGHAPGASAESTALPRRDFRLLSRLEIINLCRFEPAASWSQLGQPWDAEKPG